MAVRRWLGRYGDPFLVACLAGCLAFEVVIRRPPTDRLAVVSALLCTLPLALRRRSPLAAFVCSSAGFAALLGLLPNFDNDSFGLVAVVVFALYSLGRHAHGYEAVIGAVLVCVCVVALLRYDSPPPYDVGDIAFVMLLLGGPWGAGLAIQLRSRREQTLTARNLELRQDQDERAHAAVAAERSRIAHELHDVVSHAIAVTVLQARGARRAVGEVVDSQVCGALDAIVLTNTQALGDMRRLLSVLRETDDAFDPDSLVSSPQPSLARLDELVEQVCRSGVKVDLALTGSLARVPPSLDLTAYRIVQEALTNVLRHAGPSATARVEVDVDAEELRLSVTDTGGTFPATVGKGSGHGLIGIRERVAVVGGSVQAHRLAAGGFRLQARLPITAGS